MTTDVSGRPVELRDLDLHRFFHPRTVAVVGASDTRGRPNTAMWRKIRAWAEDAGAELHPVNPNRDDVDGIACHRSILDVPGPIDLAVILVGDAVDAFETVLDKQPAFAVIFSAGFAETGAAGTRLQRRLEQLAAGSGTRLLGPNTNLNAFEDFEDLPGRKIALITQSGHQGRPIFQAQELGIALSHWAPTGNEADLEFADFARYFADQEEVGVVAAYIEGFKDGRTLQLAADHCARREVPLVVVKVGRTDEGRSMARSHTGHLTGSDRVVDGVFRQYGVTRVDGLDQLQDTAAMLARSEPPTGHGVCIYAISGGTGAHMADLCADAGLELPTLTAATQAELRRHIPGYLRVSNPVDCGGPPAMDPRGRQILEAIVADPRVDVVICPITGALPTMSGPLARDLVAVAATTDKPVCVIWGSPVTDDPAYTEILLTSPLPVFRTFANCVQAVSAYFDHHDFVRRYRSPFARPRRRRSSAAGAVDALLRPGPLNEHESKQVLAAYGVDVTREVLCGTGAEAARAVADLGGRVVMKVASPDILHKSDHGLVALDVDTAAAARRTYDQLLAAARRADRSATVDGVLVSEQVGGGVETVVGISTDPLFGPTVMFGLGGVFVEVFEDVSFRVPPFDRAEARRMIHETRGSALLRGARGRPRAAIGELVDTLMAVQRLATECPIAELDVNPLLVTAERAVALDALVIGSGP